MKKFYLFLVATCLSLAIPMNAQKVYVKNANLKKSHLEIPAKLIEATTDSQGEDVVADVFTRRNAPAATNYDMMKNSTPQYVDVQKTATDNCYNVFIKTQYNGSVYTGFVIKGVNFGSNTAINGSHTFSSTYSNCTESDNWFCQAYGSPQTYVDNPYGTIKFTYQSMGSDGYPIYRVQISNCYGYTYNSSYGCVNWKKQGVVFSFDQALPVHPYSCDASTRIDFTDYYDAIKVIATDVDSYVDNTGASAEWKYWKISGQGLGADCKDYTFTIKYNASTTLGTFDSSLADMEVTELYQGSTKIDFSSVTTTVTEYSTGNYYLTAVFVGTDGNKYEVIVDFYDECISQSAWYVAYDFNKSSDNITIDVFTDPEKWVEPGYGMWYHRDKKDFIRISAYNSEGVYVQCLLWVGNYLDANTQTYTNGVGPKVGTYSTYVDPDVYTEEDATDGLIVHWTADESLVSAGNAVFFNQRTWTYKGYWGDYTDVSLDCYYSTFVATRTDETTFSDIISLEGYTVEVAEGKDGYPYITFQTGGSVAISIGEPALKDNYKLNTYVNGRGSVTISPEQCLYDEGTQIILTPVPDNDDWTFSGWTGECANLIMDNGNGTYTYTVPDYDCSVIANFTDVKFYTLTWDVNGGNELTGTYTHGTNIDAGEFIEAPADPTREGYTFAGWLNSITGQIEFADGGYLTSTIEMPAEDLTFTAQWTEIPHNYIITFQDTEADGGYEWGSDEFAYGTTPVYSGAEPTKDADEQYTYEFAGWTDGENEYQTGADLPAVTGEATYYAVYTSTKVQYTLTWDFNGGATASAEEDYTHGLIDWGTAIIAPENPTMQGYTFTGWDAESVAAEMPTQDLTYAAQWEANTYTVRFDNNNEQYQANGAITGEMEDQMFTYDAEDVALTANAYEWTGHTFQGWATAADGEKVYEDGEAVSNLTAEQNGVITLYAVWDINEYTITFQDAETDGGNVWGSDDFAYGTVPAYNGELMPSKEADEQYTYQFAGWKDAAGIEYPIGTDLPAVEGETTYYAVYIPTKVSYELVWDVNGGDELTGDYTQGTVEWGTEIVAPAAPTREGYTFTGWMNGNTNEIELPAEETNIMPFAMPVDGLTYAAQWEANAYYVHFFDNGEYYEANGAIEGTMPDQTFYYDEGQYLQANAFTWEGHTFQGWATTADGDVVYGDVEDITDNLTSVKDAVIELYAVWKTDTYTITFKNSMGDDDRVWWSGELAYGVTPVYEGETPVKAADADYTYTFAGWMVNLEEQYPIGTDLPMVTEDATYLAMYTQEKTQFAVRFVNPDGSELQRYELPIGAVPAYDGVPTQANEGDEYNYYVFTFTGWVDEADNTYGVNVTLPAVTGEITYTAQYSKQLFINLQEQMDDDYYTDFSDKYNGERATTATLVRQFDQGKWATLCLPFNVNAAVLTSSGLKSRIYEFKYTKGDAENGFTLYFAQANKLDAGKGYIVNANAVLAQKTQFVFPNVVVNTNADIQSGFDITTLEGYNSQGNIYLVGTLRQGKVLGDDGSGIYYMGLSSNKIKLANSTTGTVVRAYRGIFRSTERIQVPRVRIVAESEDGEIVDELEVVDGEIMEANAPYKYVQDGILYIVRDGVRYTAEGQRID